MKIETLIKQPGSRCQKSETPVAHLQIVAQQIQDSGFSCLLAESLTELRYQLVRFLTNPLAESYNELR